MGFTSTYNFFKDVFSSNPPELNNMLCIYSYILSRYFPLILRLDRDHLAKTTMPLSKREVKISARHALVRSYRQLDNFTRSSGQAQLVERERERKRQIFLNLTPDRSQQIDPGTPNCFFLLQLN